MKKTICLIVFLFFVVAGEAFACKERKFEYALEEADVVFVGKATKVVIFPRENHLRPFTTSFEVFERLKGKNLPDNVTVEHIGNDCYNNTLPPTFKKGEMFVVFAIKKDGKYITNQSFLNIPLDYFIEKLKNK